MANGVSKNSPFHTDFQYVNLILFKNVPKSFSQRNWFANWKIVPVKWVKLFLSALFIKVKCTFKMYKKMYILVPDLTYSKKKSFHLKEESMCTFYELKKSKIQATSQYFIKTVFYKQVLDFHRTCKKFYARHLGVKITGFYCSSRPSWAEGAILRKRPLYSTLASTRWTMENVHN